ncbi:MAG: HAD family phosphatase [Pseudomonadota bacterium]
MKPQYFVFDLAGVLLNWNPEPFYRQHFCGDSDRFDHFFTHVFDDNAQTAISAGESVNRVIDRLVEAHPDYDSAIKAYREHWHDMLPGEIGGTVAAFGELRERGYPVFALGNWSREEFEWAQSRFAFLNTFDQVLLSGDCGYLKPDDRIFELAETRFGVDPASTVFIDDRPENVHAAIARGWNGIVFENPRQLYLVLMEYNIL